MKQGISQVQHWYNYTLALIDVLRKEHGYTNARIGRILGISGQAVGMVAPRKKT